MASSTYGVILEAWNSGGSAWVAVGGLTNLTPPTKSADAPPDATAHDSPSGVRVAVPAGTFTWTDCTADMLWLPSDAGQALLDSLFGLTGYFRVTLASNPLLPVYFGAEVVAFPTGPNPLVGVSTRTLTLKPSGDWPAKIIAPAISATPAVLNGGFETAGGGGADVFASWTESTAGTSAISQDAVTFRGGLASCKIVVDGSGDAAGVKQTVLTGAKHYRLSLWAKADVACAVAFNSNDTANAIATPTLTTSWAFYSYDFTAAGTVLGLYCSAAGRTVNFDDVTLICLDP
jgi:hypothetical protein